MSSWLRNAMNKAVEVGNKNNLTRTVKNYADTVVHQAGQAVAEGAKIFQDRIGVRNFKSVNQTIRRLEDAAISCRGPERVMLLRRWLAVLKEVDKIYGLLSEDKEKMNEQLDAFDEAKDGPRKPSMVLYYDTDSGGEPLNFHDVFLQSQALEAMTVSMILEAPNEDEISLLLEMFGLCLTGGKEVHNAITSSIQDLATAVSKYRDEVLIFVSASVHGASFGLLEYLSLNLITERKIHPNDAPCTDALTNIRVKREELLQFAQTAITGLKINADIERMDAETSDLKKRLEGMKALQKSPDEGIEQTSEKTTKATIEDLKEALAQIRVCSRLEGLLLKKKLLSYGDSPEIHAQKVDKLKVLSESLSNSTIKAEKRIADHRSQKEEALKVRVVKASEAIEKEKEIGAEISELVKQRDHLEAELKKVNISLAAAEARLRNAQEERDQFDVANDQIVEHLKTKEDELLKSIAACRAESNVLGTWINFLEDTWALQCSHTEMKDKQVSEELEKHEDYFVNLAISLLSAYKKELGPSISRIGKFVENLENLREGSEIASGGSDEDSKELNPRKHLEEEYLDFEAKIITTFSVVDNMKEQFYAQRRTSSRKDDPKVKELFDDIEKLRQEFESVERPNLELENLSPKAGTLSNEMSPKSPSSPPMQGTTTQKPDISERREKPVHKTERALDPEAELAKLESEFGKVGQDYSGEEIGDWEFDELEREFKTGDSAPSK